VKGNAGVLEGWVEELEGSAGNLSGVEDQAQDLKQLMLILLV
jgi:hypothetical protein